MPRKRSKFGLLAALAAAAVIGWAWARKRAQAALPPPGGQTPSGGI